MASGTAAHGSLPPTPSSTMNLVDSTLGYGAPDHWQIRRWTKVEWKWFMRRSLPVLLGLVMFLIFQIRQGVLKNEVDRCVYEEVQHTYTEVDRSLLELTEYAPLTPNKFRLLQVDQELTLDDAAAHINVVLFVHGNRGHFTHVQHIAKDIQEAQGGLYANSTLFFSCDMNGEPSAWSGIFIRRQAAYVAAAARYIADYMQEQGFQDRWSLLLLAHSMGGRSSAFALAQEHFPRAQLHTILTVASPLRVPVVNTDYVMHHDTKRADRYWSREFRTPGELSHVNLVSVSGGRLDFVDASWVRLNDMRVPQSHRVQGLTRAIPRVAQSVEHQAMMECSQLTRVLADAATGVFGILRSKQNDSIETTDMLYQSRKETLEAWRSVINFDHAEDDAITVAPHRGIFDEEPSTAPFELDMSKYALVQTQWVDGAHSWRNARFDVSLTKAARDKLKSGKLSLILVRSADANRDDSFDQSVDALWENANMADESFGLTIYLAANTHWRTQVYVLRSELDAAKDDDLAIAEVTHFDSLVLSMYADMSMLVQLAIIELLLVVGVVFSDHHRFGEHSFAGLLSNDPGLFKATLAFAGIAVFTLLPRDTRTDGQRFAMWCISFIFLWIVAAGLVVCDALMRLLAIGVARFLCAENKVSRSVFRVMRWLVSTRRPPEPLPLLLALVFYLAVCGAAVAVLVRGGAVRHLLAHARRCRSVPRFRPRHAATASHGEQRVLPAGDCVPAFRATVGRIVAQAVAGRLGWHGRDPTAVRRVALAAALRHALLRRHVSSSACHATARQDRRCCCRGRRRAACHGFCG
ncbi:MAG: hypothetical protein MHM6MM_000654 [Cercozoa sp. M6MM]